MKALGADVTQGLEKGSVVTCADNTGARELRGSNVMRTASNAREG